MRKRKTKQSTIRFTPAITGQIDHLVRATGLSRNCITMKLIALGAAHHACDATDCEDIAREIELAQLKHRLAEKGKAEWKKLSAELIAAKRPPKRNAKTTAPRTVTPTPAT